ncbi:hypothetical protein A1O3_04580 [Capronia epimyces CBS 606.96]|uniref:Uncharacterized protein n=1 Tax=Capronia epimyces CBS 606.96 TaxID=1182542 RepID=W9YZA0_9EURO|nr:uncharacterized protein A1O3_04580 [Capronia epimyces CBS 606.96]EXJ87619.1 hypothetical protein A1O3_04580 [Capronia epimyces CBS 606.96]
MATTLKVLIFRGTPDGPSSRHTALFIETSNGSNLMVHIIGQAPYFTKAMKENIEPRQSTKFLNEISVATITGKTIAQIGAVLYSTPIQSSSGWNCHNWVRDALQRLVDKHWIIASEQSLAVTRMMNVVNGS